MKFMVKIGGWMLTNDGLYRWHMSRSRGKQKAGTGGDKQLRVGTALNTWWGWRRVCK